MKKLVIGMVLAMSASGTTHAQLANLQITEVMFNPAASSETKYEWVEVRNVGSSDIDLDGYTFRDYFNFVGNNALPIPANIINTSSGGASPNTVVPGTASGNNVAVLYNGFQFGFDDNRFRAGWNLPASVPVIAVDFFPSLNNSGIDRQIGFWSTIAAWEADSPLTDTTNPPDGTIDGRRTNSFANAELHFDFTTTAGFPSGSGTENQGKSIYWDGTGDVTDGSKWKLASVGVDGATGSVSTFFAGGSRLNGEDFGSPNQVPAGTPAPGLLITEIMVDPGEGTGQAAGSGNERYEWIEILNNTGSAIDFSTGWVFDDRSGAALTSANINAGSVAQGAVAVLFDGGDITAADMETMWGPGNYIPVSEWGALSNGGTQIGIWSSLAAYTSEAVTGDGRTFANAEAALTYDDLENDWPDTNGGSSFYLKDISAANANDSFAGGPLLGDFNGDAVVDLADYTVWRDNLGSSDPLALGGNGDEDGGSAGVVDEADYLLWKLSFGESGSGSTAVPALGTLWDRSSNDFGGETGPGQALPSMALNGQAADYLAGDTGSPGIVIIPGSLVAASTAVPEPSSCLLAFLGLVGAGALARARS